VAHLLDSFTVDLADRALSCVGESPRGRQHFAARATRHHRNGRSVSTWLALRPVWPNVENSCRRFLSFAFSGSVSPCECKASWKTGGGTRDEVISRLRAQALQPLRGHTGGVRSVGGRASRMGRAQCPGGRARRKHRHLPAG